MTLTEAYDAAKTAAPSAATVAGAVLDEALGEHDGWLTLLLTAAGYTAPANSDIATLLSRLTATRAGYLDLLNTYLDATISSRAAAATALSSAVWTAQKAGYLDMAVSGVVAPTVEEIDAELTATHGEGGWTTAEAVGAYSYSDVLEDEGGDPISGAKVEAYSSSDRGGDPVTTTTSDGNGAFTLHFVASGTYYFRAVATGYDDLEFSGVAT